MSKSQKKTTTKQNKEDKQKDIETPPLRKYIQQQYPYLIDH